MRLLWMSGKGESSSCQHQPHHGRLQWDERRIVQIGNLCGLKSGNQPTSRSTGQILHNPNFLFHSCCEERRLPAACVQKCHFNTYEKDALEAMFVGTDECPIDFLPEMQFCAAQGMDHTK
ncbi:DB module, partial [Ostertagia ostertagi]